MLAGPEWTDDRVAMLKRLWVDGLSAAQIANELNCGLSRNAVLGKAFRLKLPGHRKNTGEAVRSRPPKQPPARKSSGVLSVFNGALAPKPPPPPPEPRADTVPTGTGIQLLALTEFNCHFPLGDPLAEDFEFCGKPARAGQPYCTGHCRVAFNGLPQRRRIEPDRRGRPASRFRL